jgi:hypothetical protein
MPAVDIRSAVADQANRVFDIADPDQFGKIVRAGSEVSEVRFDDGAERNVPNDHLRAVEAVDDGLSQPNPSPVSEIIRLGQEAMARKRRAWDDWLAIAEALQAGRTEVMRSLHTNEPRGRRYEKAMGEWLVANSFKEIDKGTRKRLLDCLTHKTEIAAWRARLTDGERFAFNHPDTVLRKWKAATVVPNPDAPAKISPVQKWKEAVVTLQEENDRMKREIERGGGDLFTADDRPRDIVRVLIGKLGQTKAEKVAREILKTLRNTPEERAALEEQIEAVRRRSVKEHISPAEWADVDRMRRRVKRLQETGR